MPGPRSVFGGKTRPVELNLGMFGCYVTGFTAREKEESLNQVCTGSPGAPHAPTKVSMPTKCVHCGEVQRQDLARGREIGKDTWVVVSQEDVAAIKNVDAFKGCINLAAHPAEDVEAQTRWGDKCYYLAPAEKTNPTKYTVIRDLIKTRQDKAFVACFAVRTAVGMFRLTVVDDVLVMQELVRSQQLKAAPEVPAASYQPGTVEAASAWLDQNIATAFNADDYADKAQERLEAHLAALQAVDGATGELPAPPTVPVVDQAADVLDFFTNALAS